MQELAKAIEIAEIYSHAQLRELTKEDETNYKLLNTSNVDHIASQIESNIRVCTHHEYTVARYTERKAFLFKNYLNAKRARIDHYKLTKDLGLFPFAYGDDDGRLLIKTLAENALGLQQKIAQERNTVIRRLKTTERELKFTKDRVAELRQELAKEKLINPNNTPIITKINKNELKNRLNNHKNVASIRTEQTHILKLYIKTRNIVMDCTEADKCIMKGLLRDKYDILLDKQINTSIKIADGMLQININPIDPGIPEINFDTRVNFKAYEGYYIPHPHTIGENSPCLGDFAPVIQESMRSHDIETAVAAILEFLSNYDPNDSAGRMAVKWWVKANEELFHDTEYSHRIPITQPYPDYGYRDDDENYERADYDNDVAEYRDAGRLATNTTIIYDDPH
jgi:hypothetical protein